MTTFNGGTQGLNVVFLGEDFGVRHWGSNTGALDSAPEQDLGGTVRYDPFALATGPTTLDIFVIGTAGHLHVKTVDTSRPAPIPPTIFADLGGVCVSSPVAVLYDIANKKEAAFILGLDGAIWACVHDGTWQWKSLAASGIPTFLPESISACTQGSGRIDLCAIATTNVLYHRAYINGTWLGWESLGTDCGGRSLCFMPAADRFEVVAKNVKDNVLYSKTWNNNQWFGWTKIGSSPVILDPSGDVWCDHRLDLVAVNVEGNVVHAVATLTAGQAAAWSTTWDNVGGTIHTTPKCVVRSAKYFDVVVRGVDSAFWRKWWNGSRWVDWKRIGGRYIGKPA